MREYAREVGRDHKSVHFESQAAEVLNQLNTPVSALLTKTQHLAAIHALPSYGGTGGGTHSKVPQEQACARDAEDPLSAIRLSARAQPALSLNTATASTRCCACSFKL